MFKDTHYREGVGFVNKVAEKKYVSHIFIFNLKFSLFCSNKTINFSSERSVLQAKMINIRTTQQSQTRESTGEHTLSESAQFAPPYMNKYDIKAIMRGQRCGHMKGV